MSRKIRIKILWILVTVCTIVQAAPLIFVARLQLQRKRSRINTRIMRLEKFLSKPSLKEQSKLQFELMEDIKRKIEIVSDRMFDIELNTAWQTDYWMKRAEQFRHDGYAVLAVQYENFVKYEIDQRQNEIQQKFSVSKEGSSK